MKDHLDILDTIQRVPPPPGLKEKVMHRIADKASPLTVLAIAASLAILICTQVIFLAQETSSSNYDSSYGEVFTENDLYHVE